MKLETSEFILSVKPLLKKLIDRLYETYPYASVLACDSQAKSYRVSKGGVTLSENGVLAERGFVLRVYDGKNSAEYSFSSISEDKIDEIVEIVKEKLVSLASLLPEGCEVGQLPIPSDEPLVFAESTEYELHPEELGDEKIIDLLTRISEKGRAYDERIIDCIARCGYQSYTKLFLSGNRDMLQNVLWMDGGLFAMAAEGELIQDAYSPISTLGGAEVLSTMEQHVTETCDKAIALLSAEPMIPGEYDCVCTPDVTGMIVHEAFGHGVEMDMFVKDRALAKEYIGQYVASPLITMHDGGKTISQVASYFFDDDGVPASDTIIIDKGILKTGICDLQSSGYLGCRPTGNGRRENTEHKSYTRMTNTIFEHGTSKVSDMIASIDYGFLLSDASSGMEDPKNWGIQLMVGAAHEIKDGKLTGKIFSPIVLTGYVPDLLKSISMISDEHEASGSGYCGKGYKEWVKVSDGGPYIKAKIRLG